MLSQLLDDTLTASSSSSDGATFNLILIILATVAGFWAVSLATNFRMDRIYASTRHRLLRALGVDASQIEEIAADLGSPRSPSERMQMDHRAHDRLPDDSDPDNGWGPVDWNDTLAREKTIRDYRELKDAREREDRFTILLVDYYAYGLSRAKIFSNTSLVMSIIGGGILLTGVTSLIFQAQFKISVASAGITTGAGVLTNVISILFHKQANNALNHMQSQTTSLRDDMRSVREASQAIQQLDYIHDNSLRDHLRGSVILRLADTKLPNEFSLSHVSSAVGTAKENMTPAVPTATERPLGRN